MKRISSHEATVGDWMDEINIRKIVGPTKVSSSVIRETQSLPEKERIGGISAKTIGALFDVANLRRNVGPTLSKKAQCFLL